MKIIQQMLQNQAMSILSGNNNQSDASSSFSGLFQDILTKQINDLQSSSQTQNHPLYPTQHQSMMPLDVEHNHQLNSGKASQFDTYIENSSHKHGVDKGLIHAVINTESGYNPNALSGSGAEGLMQLMPGTASGLGVENAFDPEQNIDGGTKYLRQMLDRYDGNIEWALAAYNAGPGNVDTHQGIPPYEETTNYVQKVIHDYIA